MDALDPSTWDPTGTNTGDPLRYPTADARDVADYAIPGYDNGADNGNVALIPEQDTPDANLRDDEAPQFPVDIFEEHLHRFFTAYAKDYDTYGQAIPLSGAGGTSAIAAGGPGVIYGFSLINTSTVTPVFLTIYRGIDQTAIPIMYLSIPTATDATHPGVLNYNLGTNGLGYGGLLSYGATAQFAGAIIVRKKVAL
jgi:hypothetical protein